MIVACFEVPSGYFVGQTEENYKKKTPQISTAGLRSEILILEPDNTNRKFEIFENDVKLRHIKHRLKYSQPQLKRPRLWQIFIIPQIFHYTLSTASTSVIPVSHIQGIPGGMCETSGGCSLC